MTLSKRIKAWRAAKGWSQATLADRLDISPAAVAQWERSKEPTVPAGRNLDALVRSLGISHEEFYGDVPAPKRARFESTRGARAIDR